MSSDLLAIGASGTKAARVALDVTAQNIANAATEGYVRRSAKLQEVSSAGGFNTIGDISLSGVRLDKVVRNADVFRQAEVRRTGADAARAAAEVNGLQNTEAAIEQSGVYESMVKFEGSLQQLVGDPTSSSLRANVIEDARTMAGTFNIASNALDSAGSGLRFEATDGVAQVNTLAQELSRVNLRLARAADSTSDQTSLLDQRDNLMQQLSSYVDVSATINADSTVDIRLGGTGGSVLVQGGTAHTFGMTTVTTATATPTAAAGTISFDVDGGAVAPSGGSLAGKAQALVKLADVHTKLDAIANTMMSAANTAQGNGVGLNGTTGLPLFSGGNAATMTLALTDAGGIATAPANAGVNSRDPANLNALRTALAANDPTSAMDGLLFDISGTVAGRMVTSGALKTIADTAKVNLAAQAGVDLDTEAVNLVRFQQAFQASGRVMQVAQDTFNTLLGIK